MSFWEILLFYFVVFLFYFLFSLLEIFRAKYDDLLSDIDKKKIIKYTFSRCKRKWVKDVTVRSAHKTFENYLQSELDKKFEYEKYVDYYIWGTKIGGQQKEN